MRTILFLISLFLFGQANAQVYNYGANELTFKNLIENGVTYVKTSDAIFDSIVIATLEEYWTLTHVAIVDQYKRPEKNSTALFVTTKEWTKKHMMDRKNQHVFVLQPAQIYVPRKSVDMEQTLGYMYLNGFYDLVSETNEYRYASIVVRALHQGLSFIKNKRLTGEPSELNAKVAQEVIGTDPPRSGNILIINREQTRHAVDEEILKKMNIEYRLLGEEEYYETLEKKDPKHVILYFSVNKYTELALVKIATEEVLYANHFRENYPSILKKEWKKLSVYF